jgi:glycosyltransferase involved in cell wall biosynthesis
VYTADKNLGPFIEHGLYHKDPGRFVKYPNGMEPLKIKAVLRTEIGMPQDAFVLCCVSRAVPEKGWSEAIEAVTKARDMSGRDIRLTLVGNGLVYDEYCRTGVPEYVYLAGFDNNSVGFYALADMGIMLTKFKNESFPLTIIDCLFAGKPYISCDVGEIRNMLTEGNDIAGAVVSLTDWQVSIDEASEIIAAFSTDTHRYEEALLLVPKLSERYRIDNVVKQYVELFKIVS